MPKPQRQPPAVPPGMPTVADLLDSTNPVEQAAKVQALIEAVQTPPVAITVLYDGRSRQVRVEVMAASPISYESAHKILAAAAEQLREQERQQIQTAPAAAPAAAPPAA